MGPMNDDTLIICGNRPYSFSWQMKNTACDTKGAVKKAKEHVKLFYKIPVQL
jgi:hypothetical protein